MTSETTQEEHPWGFERKDGEESTIVTQWKLDALNEKVERLTLPMKDVVQAAMAGLKAAMANLADRGPNPDAPFAEVNARLNDIERALDRRIGDYHESPKRPKGDSQWTDRIMSGCVTLVVIGIPSLILMYGKLQAIEANQVSQQKQIDALSSVVEKIRQ
jgi:hypothetical protein